MTFLLKNGTEYSRFVFLAAWALGTPSVLLGRATVRHLFGRKWWWPVSAVILGSGPAAKQLARSLKNTQSGLRISGVLLEDPALSWEDDLPPVMGHLSDAPMVTARGLTRYGILAMPNRSHAEIRQIIQDHCRSFHHLLIVTDMPGICCLGISAREIGGQVGLEIPQRLSFLTPKVMKRCLDICVSSLLLLMLLPLFLLICAAIKATSQGPVFFGHLRYAQYLADIGWTVVQQARQMAHCHAALPNPVLTVKLADWVTDFAGDLARVVAHFGLPSDPACERFYEADSRVRTVSRAQVRQPVNARGLGRWRTYAARLAPLIAELEQAGALEGWDHP
jgi:hypothetical protein